MVEMLRKTTNANNHHTYVHAFCTCGWQGPHGHNINQGGWDSAQLEADKHAAKCTKNREPVMLSSKVLDYLLENITDEDRLTFINMMPRRFDGRVRVMLDVEQRHQLYDHLVVMARKGIEQAMFASMLSQYNSAKRLLKKL